MKHLLDSNTLIEAKNRYYSMAVCPGYWNWLLVQNQAEQLASIVPVREELIKGNDELTQWAHDNGDLFHDISDADTQMAYAKVVAAVAEHAPAMHAGAMDEFLRGADPWLIARAMTTGAVVVTHEVYNAAIKRKFIIPNVCEWFGVPYMNTFDLLGKLEAQFILQP
ncbi:DUF4411 family protein [Pseudomonas putida]